MAHPGSRRKFAIHGPVVELECSVSALERGIESLMGIFDVPGWPDGFLPMVGSIRPYDQAEVLRYLSPTARHLMRTHEMLDVYEEGERFWLVDDRWGMSEINILKGQWRSWVLPQPKLDAYRVLEMAMLWPMSQLLRCKGLHLLPAVSAVREGFAVLVICPFSLEPELTAMIASGYKIIGQRWTAVREEDGRLALLHVPGRVERIASPRLRAASGEESTWTNLAEEYLGSWQNHAFCDAVLIAEPGRRPKAHLRDSEPANAVNLLRRAWPIAELHPTRRQSQLPARLAQSCRCYELQLSKNSRDLLTLLNSMRYSSSLTGDQSAAA